MIRFKSWISCCCFRRDLRRGLCRWQRLPSLGLCWVRQERHGQAGCGGVFFSMFHRGCLPLRACREVFIQLVWPSLSLYHPRVWVLPVPQPADSEALKVPKHAGSKLPPPKSSCLKNSSHQMGESPAPRCLIGGEEVQADAGTSGPQHPQHSPCCLQLVPTRVGPLRLRGTSPVYLASAPREVGDWSSFSSTKSCFEAERDFCCPYLSLLDTVLHFCCNKTQ